MPVVNLYNIVTNDEFEIPLACDIVGTSAVAKYLGMKENYVSRCICTGRWSHLRKKKAVVVGTKEDLDWDDEAPKVKGMAGKPKRPVLQIDVKTNEIVMDHPSVLDAARAVGCKSSSNISMCCKNKYWHNTVCGYKWKYKKVNE